MDSLATSDLVLLLLTMVLTVLTLGLGIQAKHLDFSTFLKQKELKSQSYYQKKREKHEKSLRL